MSDIRRNRINLLNNDSFRTTSALTGILSVLGKSPTGATCAGQTATECAEVLPDQRVEHNQIGYGRSVRCRSLSAAWGREGDDPGGGRSLQGEGHHGDGVRSAARKYQKRDRARKCFVPLGQPARLSLCEADDGLEGTRISGARVCP
jgi:hypothetical protein